jgi:hypothetical protein
MDINSYKEALDPDFSKRLFNTLFHPLESENIIKSPTGTPLSNALTHGAGLAAGYGSLAFIIRTIQKAQAEAKRNKDKDSVESNIKASHPHLDDPTTEIDETEELEELEEKRATVELLKEAGMFGPDTHSAHLAIAVGLTLMGAAGGYKLSDYIADKDKGQDIDSEIEDLRRDIKEKTVEEYNRVRGIEKKAESYADFKNSTPEDDGSAVVKAVPLSVKSLYVLYAAAVGALAYKVSRTNTDELSETRTKLKKFQDATKQLAKSKKAPVIGNLPSGNAAGEAQHKQLGSVSLPKENLSPAQASVDKSDPYAGLL